jgi:DNA-binding Lrp family transcriptional regulator
MTYGLCNQFKGLDMSTSYNPHNDQLVYNALASYIKEHGTGPRSGVLVELTQLPQTMIWRAIRRLTANGIIKMQMWPRDYRTIQLMKPFDKNLKDKTLAPVSRARRNRVVSKTGYKKRVHQIRQIIQRCVDAGKPVPKGAEIGKMVGLQRRSTNRIISELARDGVIKMLPRQYDTIKVLKPVKLDTDTLRDVPTNVVSNDKLTVSYAENRQIARVSSQKHDDIAAVFDKERKRILGEKKAAEATIAKLDRMLAVINETAEKLKDL